jgi:hypothetical protein
MPVNVGHRLVTAGWFAPLKTRLSGRRGRADEHELFVPLHAVSTTDFGLTQGRRRLLYAWGVDAAHDFFMAPRQQAHLSSFGKTLERQEVAVAG